MRASEQLCRRARPWLGTIVEIAVPHRHEDAIDAGFAAIERIHRLMSFHDEASDLAAIRTARSGQTIRLAPETIAVLRIAADLHTASNGLFNVAVGRQLVKTRFLPRMDIVHLGRFNGGMSDMEILDDCHIRLRRCTLIDLGGIAKGYAVDCAVEALQAAGVSEGIVNAGGDLRVFGEKPRFVEVRMAFGGLSEPMPVHNSAVASSENSNTRRSFRGQVATPHIGPDGKSLSTAQTVTVVANTCVIADAMTKVAMVDADLADRLVAGHNGHVVRYVAREAA